MATSPDSDNGTLLAIIHPHWLQSDMEPLSHAWHLTFAVTGLFVFLAGFAGNLTVILLFVRFRCLRSFSNLFVLNLTVADFLLCMGNVPMFISASFSGHWLFDVIGCRVYAFIGSVTSFVSINTLAAIAIDRCMVIVRTFFIQNRPSRRVIYISLGSIWIYSVLWSIGPLCGWGNFILEGTYSSCTFDFLTRNANNRSYVAGIFAAHFIIPVSVITVSYSLIFRVVRNQRRELALVSRVFGEQQKPFGKQTQTRGMKNDLKTAKVSLIIISVFCISWFPYATIALIGTFGDQTLVTRLGSGVPCICAKFSTVMNPLIYSLLHPKFREKILNKVTCRTTSDYMYELPLNIQRGTDQLCFTKTKSTEFKMYVTYGKREKDSNSDYVV